MGNKEDKIRVGVVDVYKRQILKMLWFQKILDLVELWDLWLEEKLVS